MFYFDFPVDIQSLMNAYWWQINFLLLFLFVGLAYLSVKKPALAAGLTIILLPTYLFRSKIGFLPFTFLEICLLTTLFGWLINKIFFDKETFLPTFKFFYLPVLLIIIAASVSIFFSPDKISAAGIWKAYFIEPILFFFVLRDVNKKENGKKIILYSLGLIGLLVAVFAVYQKFSAFGIAQPSWILPEKRRVTSFFTSPNAIGLFLGPIMLIYFGWLIDNFKNGILKFKNLFICLVLILGAIAICFSVSQGSWLGLLAGLIFFSFVYFSKKWTAAALILAGAITLGAPWLREKIIPIILFKDLSGQNRLILWQMAKNFLVNSPMNFIFGAGIGGFAEMQNQLRDPLKMEPLLYPHNIFLNFWLETGLLGLLGFIAVLISFFKKTKDVINKNLLSALNVGIASAMIYVLIHGLIDVPYFKNDLAVLFWIIISLI